MALNNRVLTSLNLGGSVVPDSGETGGIAAAITPGERYTVQDGVQSAIFSKVVSRMGILVVTCYPSDIAYPILMNLSATDDATLGNMNLFGTMVTATLTSRWTSGRIRVLPDHNREGESSTVSFTIDIDGLTQVPN